MAPRTTSDPEDQMLDVRGMRKPDKHPTIFATYDALPVGDAFVLVNDHDPRHLREEFETRHAGGFGWEYLNREMRDWRIRITKLAGTPLPRVLADIGAMSDGPPTASGAAWRLEVADRDLDANLITLPPHGAIDAHTGPDLDVLIHVLSGGGTLTTELHPIDLAPGQLLWLPRRSRRQFDAGAKGLRYLTVHRRREALVLAPPSAEAPR